MVLKSAPTNSHRAGRYVRQPAGHQAFHPASLPPDPPIDLSGNLHVALSTADRALGRLDGSVGTLPNPELFVAMYVRKEAVLSSQIEGTQSSLHDLLSAEAEMTTVTGLNDVGEVINYVRAMNYGLNRLDELPVSARLIREIHERLMQGVRGSQLTPGEVRRTQNWIGAPGCTLAEAAFIPPPPTTIANDLSELERFLHRDTALPLLIKIGLAHAQFETIHPFLDGNGRIGRLLITFLLCEQQVLTKPVLYLSYFFKRHRTAYYEHLQAVRDRGEWEQWLIFFLQGVAEVSDQATATARSILECRETHRRDIAEHLGRAAGNGHKVLEYLYARPIVSVSDIRELLEVTHPAANNLVARLVELDILREFTGQARNRKFRFDPYVALFADDR